MDYSRQYTTVITA